MSAYDEVLEWSESLPQWQRDALRRLASKALLDDADLMQLADACRLEVQGQSESSGMIPISSSHVPSGGSGAANVSIKAIVAVAAVNAIPDGQRLTFASDGITAVYGDNGAGKSGFARVLRHVSHARGNPDPVLPNVFADAAANPSARLEYAKGGEDRTFDWSTGISSSPDELRAVAVFDSSAASTLLERENEVLWTPGGIDLVVRLASVVSDVGSRLQLAAREVAARGRLPEVAPSTAAHAVLTGLSASTTAAVLDSIPLRPEERDELERLTSALSVADPARAAVDLRRQSARFQGMRDRAARVHDLLGPRGMQELVERWEAYANASTAERHLASTTFGDSLVPGVGGDPWRALWNSAERFAASGATDDGAFPSHGAVDLCILCQQPIEEKARERLERFHAFVRADVATTRESARLAVVRLTEEIRALVLREAGDEPLLGEMRALAGDEVASFEAFLESARTVASTVLSMDIDAIAAPLPPPLPTSFVSWIQAMVDGLDQRAVAMEIAARPDERRAADASRRELLARRALAEGRSLVDAEIERLARHATLAKAASTCATAGITRKAGELTRTHVSDRLMEAFDTEARNLRLPMSVKYAHSRNEKGTSYQRVALTEASWVQRKGGAVRVLSEGERRAVGLAAFIAELHVRADGAGVVFDDPVSSLDHERRRLVAVRLAELARERQVVVFTHDLVFLHMLGVAAQDAGVGFAQREVRKSNDASGVCRDKPPVKAMKIKDLVGELKARQQECTATFRAGDTDRYEQLLANAFGVLREAWERAVEELLLNGAVMRFDYRVQTQRLSKVHDITQSDLDEINAGMSTCSTWLPGHALAPAINERVPDPSQLLAEVQRLETFVTNMRTRGRT